MFFSYAIRKHIELIKVFSTYIGKYSGLLYTVQVLVPILFGFMNLLLKVVYT